MKKYIFVEHQTDKRFTAFAENIESAEVVIRIEYGKLNHLSIESITK